MKKSDPITNVFTFYTGKPGEECYLSSTIYGCTDQGDNVREIVVHVDTSRLREAILHEVVNVLEIARDMKYPPNRFANSETGFMSSGVQEETYVRMLKEEDLNTLKFANYLIESVKEMK